ncbi:hypothetical protein LU11_gp264 [Pseudomonas phage Lu11]|uniref:hypothetical protein n=1 Tax=Pseudomonas phage Lu11 TaxID=1161927 RepID=UPI00025F182F|nr:hypothetical protein LU11_gp264 [Pseudomonas phage Lu11]AFH14795.1 hypothetical protein Lu11_0259 [Pseudomonas phage Lu11]
MKLLEWHEVNLEEPGYYWIFQKNDPEFLTAVVAELWEGRMFTPSDERGEELTEQDDFKYYVKIDFPKAEMAKLVAEKEAKNAAMV